MDSVVTLIRNGVASMIDATVRQPHAISLNESDDLYARPPAQPKDYENLMPQSLSRPKSADHALNKSQEQIEFDTLSRIRSALYADRQS